MTAGKRSFLKLHLYKVMVVLLIFTTQYVFAWPTLTVDTNQSLQMPAADLAYSGFDGHVYLSIPANGGTLSNTLTAIVPLTGEIGASTAVGNDPGKLAASSDGQFIYVLSDSSNRIDKVSVAGGTVSLSFALGSTVSGPIKATDIAVMPGQSGTIAIVCGDGSGQPELRIYDGANLRPQTLPGTWITTLAFGENASVLYGFDNATTDRGFYVMSVSASGVALSSYMPSSPFERGAGMAYGSGFVFSTSKGIFNPSTSQMRFPFYGSSGFGYYAPLAVDPNARCVCYVLPKASPSDNLNFQVFNLDTYLPVGQFTIASPLGYFTGALIRWGTDGLAYRANTNQVIFLRTSYLPNPALAELVVRQRMVPLGSTNALQCTIENYGPNIAQEAKLNVRFEGNVTLGSIMTSGGTVSTFGTQVICDFGAQAAGTTNTLTIPFAQPFSNTVVSTVSASSLNLDPDTGNNTSILVISGPMTNAAGSVLTFTLPIVDMVADPIRSGIYLAIDRQVPDLGNGIVYFDPTSGSISPSTFVGPNISKLAISADGQVIYATSAGQLSKVDAASLTVLTNFPISQGYAVSDLSVFPTNSDVLAVWHVTQADRLGSVFSIGLGIYEGGSLLNSTNIDPTGRFRQVGTAADGTVRVFDSWNGLEILGFGISGDSLINDQDLYFPYLDYSGGEIKYQADRYYAAGGRVFDGSSQRVLGTFSIPGVDGWPNTSSGAPLVEPDFENGRVFFLRYDGTNVNLHAFDAQRYQIIGSVPVPGVTTTPSRLIRLGSGRMAFKTDKLFVVQNGLIPTGPEANLGVQLIGGANPGALGVSESYSVLVTNKGPQTATAVSATLKFSITGIATSINPSQGTANFTNLVLSWNVGSIAANGYASITLNFTPAALGMLQVTALVSGQCQDRVPFDDTSAHLELVKGSAWPLQMAQFSLPAKDLVAAPDGTNLFVSLHERGGGIGNSVLKLNPETGQLVGPVFVGSSSGHLAISSDGQKLYVGADGASAVVELNAATLQPISSFSISNGLSADYMDAVPGNSEQLLVYRNNAGLSLFDGGIEASNRVGTVTTFVFNDLTGEAFGCDRGHSGVPLYRLAVDAGGVSVAQTYPTALQQSAADLKSANGLLYYDRGLVVSPTLGSEAQRYPVSQFTAHVQPALDRHLIYFLTGGSGSWSMRAFRDNGPQPAGLQSVVGVSGTPGRLVRWGDTGLAFVTSADQLFCLRDLFTSDASAADVAIGDCAANRYH